jgi:hypothetical protein
MRFRGSFAIAGMYLFMSTSKKRKTGLIGNPIEFNGIAD